VSKDSSPGPEQRISEPEETVAVSSYNFPKQLQKQQSSAFSCFGGKIDPQRGKAIVEKDSPVQEQPIT
jgi:hypothetical protein